MFSSTAHALAQEWWQSFQVPAYLLRRRRRRSPSPWRTSRGATQWSSPGVVNRRSLSVSILPFNCYRIRPLLFSYTSSYHHLDGILACPWHGTHTILPLSSFRFHQRPWFYIRPVSTRKPCTACKDFLFFRRFRTRKQPKQRVLFP